MSVKEKLVELLTDNLPRIGDLPKCDNPLQYKSDEIVERIAAHLELNGVTVQEWISVDEKLPETWNPVIVYFKCGFIDTAVYLGNSNGWKISCHLDMCDENAVTHWIPLPEPPKGE